MAKKLSSRLTVSIGKLRPNRDLWGIPLFLSLFAITFTLFVFLVSIYEEAGTSLLPASGIFVFLSVIFWIIDPFLKERFTATVSSLVLIAIYLLFAQVLIIQTGGLSSPFFLIYYFVVFTGAMAFGITGAIVATFLIAIAYWTFVESDIGLPYYMTRMLVLWIVSLMVGFLAETKKRIERRELLQNLRLTALEEVALFMRELSEPRDVLEAATEAVQRLLDARHVRIEHDGEVLFDAASQILEKRKMSTESFQFFLGDRSHSLTISRREKLTGDEIRIVHLMIEKIVLIWEQLHYRALVESVRKEKEAVLDSIGSGVLTVDLDDHVKTSNPQARKILEESDSLTGENLTGEPYSFPSLEEFGSSTREIDVKNRAGERIPIAARVFPQFDENKEPIGRIVVFDDLKEIRRLEAVLRRSEALSAMGEMAARIAHEIRNPLGGIMGFLGLAEKKAPPEILGYIREANSAVARLENTVRELLIFSQENVSESLEFPLERAWAILMERGRMEATRDSGLTWQLDPLSDQLETVMLKGTVEQFEQVMCNLLRNAVEAVESAGKTVPVRGRARWGGPVVWLEVDDEGEGCEPETASKIFEPFVSGKAKGSGLGLSIARKIVESLGGTVRYQRVTEADREITRFRVSWPRVGNAKGSNIQDGDRK